jgi:2-polyprenyl-3-methyl-5-hydroxy-6-metoxy-1,4-benzoquinol methylase
MSYSNFWRQHYEQVFSDNPLSPLKQTGKTVNGLEIEEDQLSLIVTQIVNCLGLNNTDSLVDLGCGNGLLTARLSKRAQKVIGIDFTDSLLTYARRNNFYENIEYVRSDILEVSSDLLDSASSLVMYEVLQHLSLIEFRNLIANLDTLRPGARFFIGGIPDMAKIRSFYDNDSKYDYYLTCELEGKPHLGRWWLESELTNISADMGWVIKYFKQPNLLYTSHYRFDAVMVKQ